MEKTTSRLLLSVSQFIDLTNQTLEYAYPTVDVEGEVASFKVNQGKFVFFDLKDQTGSVGCFMMAWQLRTPIEDGMKVVVRATPKLTAWGKFSLTVRAVQPSGQGSLKKSFELLKAKLEKEGLFAAERKRLLPARPQRVAVISSVQAAGYADFVKIINDRWGGLAISVANVQVQGMGASDQIIRALRYFNEREQLPEVIVMVRGGGSADDLAVFNDELLVREIAASRVPTLVGVGHEVDVSLADLAADVRAATPSNAAQLLVPDRHELLQRTRLRVQATLPRALHAIAATRQQTEQNLWHCLHMLEQKHEQAAERLEALSRALSGFNPYNVLARGYALVRGKETVGGELIVEKQDKILTAEVTHVSKK